MVVVVRPDLVILYSSSGSSSNSGSSGSSSINNSMSSYFQWRRVWVTYVFSNLKWSRGLKTAWVFIQKGPQNEVGTPHFIQYMGPYWVCRVF